MKASAGINSTEPFLPSSWNQRGKMERPAAAPPGRKITLQMPNPSPSKQKSTNRQQNSRIWKWTGHSLAAIRRRWWELKAREEERWLKSSLLHYNSHHPGPRSHQPSLRQISSLGAPRRIRAESAFYIYIIISNTPREKSQDKVLKE